MQLNNRIKSVHVRKRKVTSSSHYLFFVYLLLMLPLEVELFELCCFAIKYSG